MIIGIDIGTSFSSVAYLKNGKAEKIRPGSESGYSVPSAVYVKDGGDLLIGFAAIAARAADPSRFKNNFKRDFGTNKPYLLGGREVTVQEIYTEYFRYFKDSAERTTGQKVSKAYITHPVEYATEKKLLMERSANYAGLMTVELVDESTAAALSFFAGNMPENGEKVLIFDLGGGTLDITLAEVADGGLRLLAQPVGDMNLGGADFDSLLYGEIVTELSKEKDLSSALTNFIFTAMLHEAAVSAKLNLSRDTSALVSISVGLGEYLTHTVTRNRFEELISPLIDKGCALIENITQNAGITPVQIENVLCVGGSTRIPFVVKRIEEIIGKRVLQTEDPELAVCMGAVLKEIVKVVPNQAVKSAFNSKDYKFFTDTCDNDYNYHYLYQSKKDGTDKKCIVKEDVYSPVCYKNCVYYIIAVQSERRAVGRFNPENGENHIIYSDDSGNFEAVRDNFQKIMIIDGNAYISKNNGSPVTINLNEKIEGKEITTQNLTPANTEEWENYNFFCDAESRYLCQSKKDDSEKTVLVRELTNDPLYHNGGVFYFECAKYSFYPKKYCKFNLNTKEIIPLVTFREGAMRLNYIHSMHIIHNNSAFISVNIYNIGAEIYMIDFSNDSISKIFSNTSYGVKDFIIAENAVSFNTYRWEEYGKIRQFFGDYGKFHIIDNYTLDLDNGVVTKN